MTPATGDWLFVVAVAAGIVVIAALPLVVMYWLLHAALGRTFI